MGEKAGDQGRWARAEGGVNPESRIPNVETEIIIRPDGRVIIADLAMDLLQVALDLNPQEPRLRKLAAALLAPCAPSGQ